MSNPALKEELLDRYSNTYDGLEKATVSGTIGKTAILTLTVAFVSLYTYALVMKGFQDKAVMLSMVGAIGALIVAFVIAFTKNIKNVAPLSFLYAGLEGLAVGAVSGTYSIYFGNSIILSAVVATIGTLLSMLFLYKAGVIKCTDTFRSTIMTATVGIAIVYILSMFFAPLRMFLFGSGALSAILINVLICAIAAFNFIIDFDTIERISNSNADKNFEWYGAFSLLVTLVWVYFEFLKLIARMSKK